MGRIALRIDVCTRLRWLGFILRTTKAACWGTQRDTTRRFAVIPPTGHRKSIVSSLFSFPITTMSCRRSRFTLSPSISCLLLLLLLFFSTVSVTRAQSLSAVTVLPSNNSQDLVWTGILRFNLRSTQVELPSVVDLAPLTRSLVASDQSSFTVSLFPDGGKPRRCDRC